MAQYNRVKVQPVAVANAGETYVATTHLTQQRTLHARGESEMN